MATTYTLISSVTVGAGGAASIDFTSIPQTYTDLIVKTSLRSSSSSVDTVKVTFNNSSTGYYFKMIYYNGSGTYSYNVSNQAYFNIEYANSNSSVTYCNSEFYISNYAGSLNKPISQDTVMEDNSTTAFITPMAVLWSNSSAITSIKLILNTGPNFLQYSTADLYGISNA